MIPSTVRSLCLLGAGEHAKVVEDAALASGFWEIQGSFAPEARQGLSHLGTDIDLLASPDIWANAEFHLAFLGPGTSQARRRCLYQFKSAGLRWATVCHPSAVISRSAWIGEGAYIGAMVVIQPGARIGAHCVINTGAIVEHDVLLGEGVHLAPRVVTGGGVEIGDWSVVGLGAIIRDHLRIGSEALIGMGAVVIQPVNDGQTVIGNPAKPFFRSTP